GRVAHAGRHGHRRCALALLRESGPRPHTGRLRRYLCLWGDVPGHGAGGVERLYQPGGGGAADVGLACAAVVHRLPRRPQFLPSAVSGTAACVVVIAARRFDSWRALRQCAGVLRVGHRIVAVPGRAAAQVAEDALTRLGQGSWRVFTRIILPILAVASLLLALNIWAYQHLGRLDLTSAKVYSISPETRRVIAKVDQPVSITWFYDLRNKSMVDALDLLKQYQKANPLIQVQGVDPSLEPAQDRKSVV